jgi:succinate dehydrogenase/fumarate reductase flavoprotein subunit
MNTKVIADEIIETDVLVIGGGLSGKFAAIAASDGGASVTLSEKSTLRRGGPYAGLDHIPHVANPEVGLVSVEDLTKAGIQGVEALIRPGLMERFARETWESVLNLEKFGIPVKWPNGKYMVLRWDSGYQTFPYGPFPAMLFYRGADLGIKLEAQVRKRGAKVLERTIATSLLTNNGKVVGATLLNVRNGKFIAVKAKATIIASGRASGGHVMAYNAGAELVNMEFSRGGGAGREPLTFSAGGFIIGHAGTPYINAKGEKVFDKWAAVIRETGRTLRPLTLLKEYAAGNGPIYLDLTNQPEHVHKEAIIALMNERPICYKFNRQRGIDYKTTIFEQPPSSRRGGFPYEGLGGVLIDEECKSSVTGLYIGGDAQGGVCMWGGATGAFVHGQRSGKYASEYVKTAGEPAMDSEQVMEERERVLAPTKRSGGVSGLEMKNMVLTIIGDYLANPRSEGTLLRGIERAEVIGERDAPSLWARNPHELMHTVNARNLIPVAKIMMKTAIMRKESRMITLHERIEYPKPDEKNWAKSIIVQKDLITGEAKLEPKILQAEKYNWRD